MIKSEQVKSTESPRVDPRLMSAVDEISDRIQHGQPVDIDTYAQQFPTHGDYLRQLVRTLQDVAELGLTEAYTGTGGHGRLREKQIGDFTLVRQIGHGGMGLVYEAQQESLDRRVALKVLQLGGMLDERQLARFKNEARAAATLHHPHIVPVFAVGSDRGIHYYAMQYIDGPSLAEILHELKPERRNSALVSRLPEDEVGSNSNLSTETKKELQAAISTQRASDPASYMRKVATWGSQAAEGLAFAHENGVLHRDIKPGNLLVDRSGKLWITDFGLARIERDASMTLTGDLVGTIRYMSPEQALAKRVLVDHRSDIYSLGVTLYEMLTFEPAFPGRDRQELLKQIAFEEPRPLRSINSAIPVELETILLKAAAKNPDERYVSAQDLADDLRAYLENRPIKAKPPTLWDRGTKWSRRHVAAVWATSLVLLAATVGLATSTWLIGSARDDAVEAKLLAEAEAQRSQRSLSLAIESLDRIYTELVGKHLADEPRLTRVREEFLQESLNFYQRIASENQSDEQSWQETGRAYLVAGRIHMDIGQIENAHFAYSKSLEVFDSLVQRFPGDEQFRYQAAEAAAEFGEFLLQLGVAEDGIGALSDAFRQLQPGGDPATPESLARQLESPQHATLLGRILQQLGSAYSFAGRTEDAVQAYRRALRLWQPLSAREPENADHHRELAKSLARLALLRYKSDAADDAVALAENAIEHQQRALQLVPGSVASRRALRNHFHTLGSIQQAEPALALAAHRHGNELATALASDYPHVIADQVAAAFSHFSLASALADAREVESARRHLQECITCWKTLPGDSIIVPQLAVFHDTIGCHPGAILSEASPDPIAVFQQTVRSSLGEANAELIRQSFVETPGVEEDELPDDEPMFDWMFDAVLDMIGNTDLVSGGARSQLLPNLEDNALTEIFQQEVGLAEPLASVYGEFYQLLLGHAQAVAQLTARLQETRQDDVEGGGRTWESDSE